MQEPLFLRLCGAYMLAVVSTLCGQTKLCATAADCSFNGGCQNGRCRCDPAWHGQQCSTLNLLPARRGAGLNTTDDGGPISSWGGTVTKGDDGLFHMFVAQFTRHCGFKQWDTNSRIVHAVANEADGSYEVKHQVWPVFAHNPAVVRAPGGEWVMTFVYNASGSKGEATCANGTVVANSSLPLPVLQRNCAPRPTPYCRQRLPRLTSHGASCDGQTFHGHPALGARGQSRSASTRLLMRPCRRLAAV